MNCKNCGNILESNATFCSKCGSKVEIETLNQMENTISVQPTQMVNPSINNNGVMPNTQQPMNNGYNYQVPNNNINIQPNPTNKKNNNNNNNNNTLFIVLIVICITVIIGLGAFIGIKLLSEKDTTPNNDTQNNASTNDKTTEKVENIGTNDTTKNKITIYGYTFTLPEYLQYNNGTDYIYAANSDVSMIFNLAVTNTDYETIKQDFSAVEQVLRSQGAIVENATEITYDGRNYILTTLNIDGYYMFYYIAKLETNYIVEGTIQGTKEEHFNSALKAIDEIIDSVEKTSSFASTNPKEYKNAVGYNGKLEFKK